MTCAKGHEVSEENQPLIAQMVEEVYAKTTGNPEFAKNWQKPTAAEDEQDGVSRGEVYPDAASEGIDPADIHF